ncbi:hypothetical protein Leryth_003577 [Lithospermum erythrorhizon]|nr:hypothetical protein Leryth_003577 [Lithospermum erythrorhizon]
MSNSRELHVAILVSPGMGHLNPVLCLGRRLTTLVNNIKVTILVVSSTMSPPTSTLLQSLGVEKEAENQEMQICMINREALPAVKSTIAAMNNRPDALIVDLFGTEAIPIAKEFNIPKYVFITTNAWNTTLWVYVQVLDKQVQGQYLDQEEPFKIPGCKPVRPEIVVDPMWDREDQRYFEYLRVGMELSLSDGVMINTWEELEPVSIRALRQNEVLHGLLKVPVYPIGPLSRPAEPSGLKDEEVRKWLHKQQADSVLYVSFGSGGTLSVEQIIELAWGLELSNQKFIWVVRPPIDGSFDGAFFSVGETGSSNDGPRFLPPGYTTRVQERGLLLPIWGQQVEILNHKSVGGFMSHCGWNSTLESIAAGVPIIGWPLYAEQALNATMLSQELGVAICPDVLPGRTFVFRQEIAMMVRRVMGEKDGKTMREKIRMLQESGKNALSEGASSYNSMIEVVRDIELRLSESKSGNIS